MAKPLKPGLLELGAKAPIRVLDGADLDQAVAAAAFGAFLTQGQICLSTEGFIVDATVMDASIAMLAAREAARPAGDPRCGRSGGKVAIEVFDVRGHLQGDVKLPHMA